MFSCVYILLIVSCILLKYQCTPTPIGRDSNKSSANNGTQEHCGLSYADRIVGGTNAALGQYPWMARLGYKINKQIQFECGGALISQRNILTAAHCVNGLPSDVKLYCVDLGENIDGIERDCVDSVCADPVQRFAIASIVSHEDYNNPAFKNDIALVGLRSRVHITEWVRPVCLPFDEMLHQRANYDAGVAEVAGFGYSQVHSALSSPYLQTLKVPILSLDRCSAIFGPTISIDANQMCVGGHLGEDTCAGDSGGPLVKAMSSRLRGPRYFLIGVVSFGLKNCGDKAPSIYTRVGAYLPWIESHMHVETQI